jgi:ABC-type transporter Mla subunit MlaD
MRRIAATVLLAAVLGGFGLLAGGAGEGDDGARKYWAVLDNAFGLVKGGDLKVAGVRAGKITDLEVEPKTNRARVGFEITELGFGSLRTDTRCESRPQSLIGEYFLDCLPGTAKQELKPGSTIPVQRTASTVPPDLVNSILRRPYRERLSIIIGSLGAAVAGNGKNLNDAVRRASPALRETDKVLKTLARQSKVLQDLARDADTVIGDLAANRKDVGRWVVEAGETAEASAERRDDIALGFRRLPGFLRELRPTMAALGRVAEEQTPALRNLNASANQLETLFDRLGPFADATRPALRSLGRASRTGDAAVKSATDTVQLLDAFAKGTPELGENLRIVLEHIDDPANAIEHDPRAAQATGRPMPTGYSGTEALLAYIYDQVLSINTFDSTQHILKVAPFETHCADYADVKAIKDDPHLEEECGARLGPNNSGLNFPDPTKPPGAGDARRADERKADDRKGNPLAPPAAFLPPFEPPAAAPAPERKPEPPKIRLPEVPRLPDLPLPDLPRIGDGIGGVLDGGGGQRSQESQRKLLDYLIAP